eukprot:gene4279-4533_t
MVCYGEVKPFAHLHSGDRGGALSISRCGDVVVENTLFLENSASFASLQEADADPATALTAQGAAVYVLAAKDAEYEIKLVVSQCRFEGNAVGTTGGAVSTNQFGLKVASVEVYDSFFTNNTAELDGGAIQLQTNIAAGSGNSLAMQNVQFTNNTSHNGLGGAVAVDFQSVVITECDLLDNVGARGGGALSALSAPQVSVTRSLLAGNAANIGPGGGLSIVAAGQVTLQDIEVIENLAATGGGVSVTLAAATNMTDVHVSNNTAVASGGGLSLLQAGNISLANSVISGNRAQVGGAMVATRSSLNIHNVKFTRNSALNPHQQQPGGENFQILTVGFDFGGFPRNQMALCPNGCASGWQYKIGERALMSNVSIANLQAMQCSNRRFINPDEAFGLSSGRCRNCPHIAVAWLGFLLARLLDICIIGLLAMLWMTLGWLSNSPAAAAALNMKEKEREERVKVSFRHAMLGPKLTRALSDGQLAGVLKEMAVPPIVKTLSRQISGISLRSSRRQYSSNDETLPKSWDRLCSSPGPQYSRQSSGVTKSLSKVSERTSSTDAEMLEDQAAEDQPVEDPAGAREQLPKPKGQMKMKPLLVVMDSAQIAEVVLSQNLLLGIPDAAAAGLSAVIVTQVNTWQWVPFECLFGQDSSVAGAAVQSVVVMLLPGEALSAAAGCGAGWQLLVTRMAGADDSFKLTCFRTRQPEPMSP